MPPFPTNSLIKWLKTAQNLLLGVGISGKMANRAPMLLPNTFFGVF
jgi:hypothetical protein